MNLKKLAMACGLASATLVGSAFAAGTASLTATGFIAPTNFTNFDWADTGTGFTTGFAPVTGTNFQFTYFSDLALLKNGLTTISLPGLDSSSNGVKEGGYEFTIVATVNERVAGCLGTTTCTFDINSGTFQVYFDTLANSNNAGGTGFQDGELLMSGVFTPTTGGTGGVFSGSGAGSGSANLLGNVTFTQTVCDATHIACITPALSGTNAVTTLQLGAAFQTAPPATGFNGVAFTSSNLVFQADANQAFAVPEPGSLALFGIGVVAIGMRLRRKQQAA